MMLGHLAETVNILKPTLVISQGWGLVDTLRDTLGVTHEVDLGPEKRYLTYCDLNGNRFVWVALYHPTRFWSTPNQSYFKDTAPDSDSSQRPALRSAPAQRPLKPISEVGSCGAVMPLRYVDPYRCRGHATGSLRGSDAPPRGSGSPAVSQAVLTPALPSDGRTLDCPAFSLTARERHDPAEANP